MSTSASRASLGCQNWGDGHDKTSRELDRKVWRIPRSKLEEIGGYAGNLGCRSLRAKQGLKARARHGFIASKRAFS